MTTKTTQDRLRDVVREAIRDAGITQRTVAAELGVSEQHISRMLLGKTRLTLDWADRITRVCGRQLDVSLTSGSAGGS